MLISFLRTVFLYLVLIAIIRFLGKRQLGQMEPSEVVVTMVVADLASISMQDSSVPISSSLIPILAVLGMELILSALSLRSVFLRKLLCGKPVILIENGKFLQDNMRKTRITLDENIRTRPYCPELLASGGAMIPVLGEDQVVLEVKFNDFLPGYLNDVLADIPKVNLAVSKYVLCLNTI